MKRLLGISAAAAALVIIAGAAVVIKPWNSGSTQSASSDLAMVRETGFEITTNATGELEAKEQIEIRSQLETQSTIVEIVPEGSVVKKGDVLVRLNTASIQDQIDEELVRVESARADVEAAESALKIQISENDSKLRAGQMRVDIAQLALQQWRDGDVVKKRKELQLAIEQAERQLKRLSDRFERSEELLTEGFVSQNERDLDEIAYIDAQAKLETARLDQLVYETYQHPRDEKSKLNELEEAKAELDRIEEQNQINLTSKESSLDNRKRTFDLRASKLAKLQDQLEAATIIAPSAGLVVYATSMQQNRWGGNDGPLQIGSTVRPNDLLMVLPDTAEMVAAVRVHESLAGRIQPGLKTAVKIDATGGKVFQGTVDSIGVLAETGGWRDPNRREYTVRVALDPTAGQGVLKPSMRAEAVITLGTVNNALCVPVQAVFNDGPIRYVYVPSGSGFKREPIAMGRRSDTLAEITSGLEQGQMVLTREPTPSEIVPADWDPDDLIAVGYTVNEEGQVMPARSAPRGGQSANRQSRAAPAATESAGDSTELTGEAASPQAETADAQPAQADAVASDQG